MPDNKSRLLKIDLWIRRFAWYYLIGVIYGIIATAITIIAMLIQRSGLIGLFGETNIAWANLVTVIDYANRICISLFIYLFLQGISKTIHYLLALMEEFSNKHERGLNR